MHGSALFTRQSAPSRLVLTKTTCLKIDDRISERARLASVKSVPRKSFQQRLDSWRSVFRKQTRLISERPKNVRGRDKSDKSRLSSRRCRNTLNPRGPSSSCRGIRSGGDESSLGSSSPRSHKRAYDKSGESRAAIINLAPVGPSKCLVANPSTTRFLTDRTVTTPATDDLPRAGARRNWHWITLRSLRQIPGQTNCQSQCGRVILILDLQGIDAPKLGEIDYIGFPGKGIAAFLQNFCPRITSGQPASDKSLLLCLLLACYCEDFFRRVGRGKTA